MKKFLKKLFSITNEYNSDKKRKVMRLFFVKITLPFSSPLTPEELIKKGWWKYEIQLETTSFCNAKCSFCPNSTLKRPKNFMTDEIFNLVIKRLKDEKLPIERFILHLNGEPLTDKKIAKRIQILKLEFPQSEVRFTTNLCLATSENLTDIINAGIDEITVSMNSIDPQEYKNIMDLDFSVTMSNLELLFNLKDKLNPNLKINISIVARPDNADMVEKFEKTWSNKAHIRVIKLGQWVNKEKYMNCEEKNNIIHQPCKILYKTINILSNGDYALCCFDAEGIVGKNIRDFSLMDAYNGDPFKRIRDFQKNHGRLNAECKNCSFS